MYTRRRTDLDCRVVATSRRASLRQSATVNSPFLAAARRVASDSSTPGRPHARRQWYSGLVARLDSCVATCRPDCRGQSRPDCRRQSPARQTYVAREGWPNSSDSSDSVGLCRTKMSRHTRLVRHAPARKSARLGPKCEESDESTSRADFRGGGTSDESGRGGATPRDF